MKLVPEIERSWLMTTRSSPSYLFQSPYSYYFRIRIPDDLRLHFAGKTEIKRSLQTGYLSDAKYKARLLAGQVQRLFRYLHGKEANAMTAKKYSKLTDDLLNDIVSITFLDGLLGFVTCGIYTPHTAKVYCTD